MLFFGGGALWAALVFPPLLQKAKMQMPPRPQPWARLDVIAHTITITVLCTASTLGALIWWPGANSAWLVVTVLAVTQFGADASVSRTRDRLAGTILGAAIAALVASVTGSEAVLIGIGLVLWVIVVAIALSPHSYFLWTVFVTPAVVLFTSSSIADVHKTDAQRLGFTVIGCALIPLASAITLGWAHYQQAHSPATMAETAARG